MKVEGLSVTLSLWELYEGKLEGHFIADPEGYVEGGFGDGHLSS